MSAARRSLGVATRGVAAPGIGNAAGRGLETNNVDVADASELRAIDESDRVTCSETIADVPIGEEQMRRAGGALGTSFDGQGPTPTKQHRRAELTVLGIIQRQSVHVP